MAHVMPKEWSNADPFVLEVDIFSVLSFRLKLYGIWGFPKIRYLSRGPKNKDYSILGPILGSPYFGKLPFRDYGVRD